MGQSSASSEPDCEAIAASGGLAGAGVLLGSSQAYAHNGEDPYRLDGVSAGTRTVSAYSGIEGSYFEPTRSTEPRRDIGPEPQLHPQQPSFLEAPPADQQHLPAEQGVASSDWIAPVAAGVGVAGMAAVAVGAHSEKDQGEIVMPPAEEKPEVPEKSSLRSTPPDSVTHHTATEHSTQGEDLTVAGPTSTTTHSATTGGELGGLESEGARETGAVFPMIRHDTNMSISQLHVPGKFPKQT